MIQIIVAEDQPLILKDLCRKIEKSDPDVRIAATAADGQTAYQKVMELKPDILFTDIKMPLLSGLELIGRLKSEGIGCCTVIISGYKDFEYAREAMKLGVDEYLLKPLSSDDICCTIKMLKEKINMEREDYIQHMLENLIRLEGCQSPHINVGLPYRCYHVALVTLGSFATFPMDYAIPHESLEDTFPVSGLLASSLGPEEMIYTCPGKAHNEGIYILCFNRPAYQGLVSSSKAVIRSAQDLNSSVTICISGVIHNIDHIGIEAQILRTFTKHHLIFGASSILWAAPVGIDEFSSGLLPDYDTLQRFRFYVRTKNKSKFRGELLSLLDILQHNSSTQVHVASCMKKLFRECFQTQPGMDFDLEIDEYITNSKSYSDLFSYLNFLAGQLLDNLCLQNTACHADPKKLVELMKAYIQEHYSENININDISTAFSLTPSYFSRLFKKYTGARPIEYLTSVRIRKACQYFDTTEYPVKHIAELCGYSDQFYFSKAFKSFTGRSPTEYRILKKRAEDV